jgi:hypothetical protein
MTRNVYALRDALGRYLKPQILEIIGGGAPPAMGNFVLTYVYQPERGIPTSPARRRLIRSTVPPVNFITTFPPAPLFHQPIRIRRWIGISGCLTTAFS